MTKTLQFAHIENPWRKSCWDATWQHRRVRGGRNTLWGTVREPVEHACEDEIVNLVKQYRWRTG